MLWFSSFKSSNVRINLIQYGEWRSYKKWSDVSAAERIWAVEQLTENRSEETASSQLSTEQEIGEVGRIFFVQSIKQYRRIYINTVTSTFVILRYSLVLSLMWFPRLGRKTTTADYRRAPQNAPQTTAGRTADHHRTAQDAPQNTAGRGK